MPRTVVPGTAVDQNPLAQPPTCLRWPNIKLRACEFFGFWRVVMATLLAVLTRRQRFAMSQPRLRLARRDQMTFRCESLDQLLPPDHMVRTVWAFTLQLDLRHSTPPSRPSRATPAHPHIDPRILFALWLYATLDGVGSARELDRLCTDHTAYQWLCGGVSVNYHTLADFRVAHPDWLDGLLTDTVAVLLHQGPRHPPPRRPGRHEGAGLRRGRHLPPTAHTRTLPGRSRGASRGTLPSSRRERLRGCHGASRRPASEPHARRPNACRRPWTRSRRCGRPARRSRRGQATRPGPAQPTPRPA